MKRRPRGRERSGKSKSKIDRKKQLNGKEFDWRKNHYYLVSLDYTTGQFSGHQFDNKDSFLEKLIILAPKELITSMGQWESDTSIDQVWQNLNTLKTHVSADLFSLKYNELYIEKLIPGHKQDKVLQKNKGIKAALGALAYYISSTQNLKTYAHIKPFQMIASDALVLYFSNKLQEISPNLPEPSSIT